MKTEVGSERQGKLVLFSNCSLRRVVQGGVIQIQSRFLLQLNCRWWILAGLCSFQLLFWYCWDNGQSCPTLACRKTLVKSYLQRLPCQIKDLKGRTIVFWVLFWLHWWHPLLDRRKLTLGQTFLIHLHWKTGGIYYYLLDSLSISHPALFHAQCRIVPSTNCPFAHLPGRCEVKSLLSLWFLSFNF